MSFVIWYSFLVGWFGYVRIRAVYGDAWEGKNGALPIRELVKIPESDVRAMQMEAQAIVTARKEEEKHDLWLVVVVITI